MIVILCESDTQDTALAIARDLAEAYNNQLAVEIRIASPGIGWSTEPSWDDLLIVLYKADFPQVGKTFIQGYLRTRDGEGFVLPVAINPEYKPPEPISGIEAMPYNEAAKGKSGGIVRRVGEILCLRLRHPNTNIFISYRAIDGSDIAQQLYKFLKKKGFEVFLDKAKDEYNDESSIPPGTDVRIEIENNLGKSDLVLLLDTPRAWESRWIRLEINIANGRLIPILPLCCRSKEDPEQGPRFSCLRPQQRGVPLSWPQPLLAERDLARILKDVQNYLLEIHARKLRIPHIAKKRFISQGFNWHPLDPTKQVYKSVRKYHPPRLIRQVLSHCSFYHPAHKPALHSFVEYITKEDAARPANFRVFIYDGEILPDPEIEDIYTQERLHDGTNLIMLHYVELGTLVASDFQRLSP
jgi:hypothetical protein